MVGRKGLSVPSGIPGTIEQLFPTLVWIGKYDRSSFDVPGLEFFETMGEYQDEME